MNRKFLASLIFAAGSVFFVSAQNVNERELRSAGDASTIVFENYEGPHSVIETAAAINSIGAGLGNQLKNAGTQSSGTFGANGKYTVIHAVDSSEQGKLDADIIIINPNATVDHIRNLRRIIASYLSAAYGYSQQDASTVATFVTVYNAVYRNQLNTFKSKYKNIVISNLTEKKCGLSIKWSDWAGNSQIVIPLGEYVEGGLSSVDTSVISDKKVVESMKEDDDKGVDERKNMVDIKEREAENAETKAQEAAKEAAQDKQALDEQKKNQAQAEKTAQAKQNEADKAKKAAENAQKEAAADPQNKAKQADANKLGKKQKMLKKKLTKQNQTPNRSSRKLSSKNRKPMNLQKRLKSSSRKPTRSLMKLKMKEWKLQKISRKFLKLNLSSLKTAL